MTIQKLYLVLICLDQISLGFSEEKPTVISLMTYNVENLFDTKDDIGKDDKAFIPASMKRNVYHLGAC